MLNSAIHHEDAWGSGVKIYIYNTCNGLNIFLCIVHSHFPIFCNKELTCLIYMRIYKTNLEGISVYLTYLNISHILFKQVG
jgi:hypothetical protein